MHTFFHEPTGVHIHYNGGLDGDAIIRLPVTDDIDLENQEFTVPCQALVAFSRQGVIYEIIETLEQMQ